MEAFFINECWRNNLKDVELFAYWVIVHAFLSSADYFFYKINFFKKINSGAL